MYRWIWTHLLFDKLIQSCFRFGHPFLSFSAAHCHERSVHVLLLHQEFAATYTLKQPCQQILRKRVLAKLRSPKSATEEEKWQHKQSKQEYSMIWRVKGMNMLSRHITANQPESNGNKSKHNIGRLFSFLTQVWVVFLREIRNAKFLIRLDMQADTALAGWKAASNAVHGFGHTWISQTNRKFKVQ